MKFESIEEAAAWDRYLAAAFVGQAVLLNTTDVNTTIVLDGMANHADSMLERRRDRMKVLANMAANMPSAGLCNVVEASEFLGISRSKVYQMMDRGDIRFVKIGKNRRIPRDGLISMVERLRKNGDE